jgi:hypothetical protein
VLSACAYEVGFDPELVEDRPPSFVAQTDIVIVLPADRRDFVYEGRPTTEVGDFTTLTVPLGSIMQEITTHVFESCFVFGVSFVDALEPDLDYLIAIEPQIRDFSYGYERAPEPNFDTNDPVYTITPQVRFDLAVKAYDAAGVAVVDKTYASGLVSGESYIVTSRPARRINQAFHAALQEIMTAVAEDVRPHLVGQCEITDFQI